MKTKITLALILFLCIKISGQEISSPRHELKIQSGVGHLSKSISKLLQNTNEYYADKYRYGFDHTVSMHYLTKNNYGIGLTTNIYHKNSMIPIYSSKYSKLVSKNYYNLSFLYYGISIKKYFSSKNEKLQFCFELSTGQLKFNFKEKYGMTDAGNAITGAEGYGGYGSYGGYGGYGSYNLDNLNDLDHYKSRNIKLAYSSAVGLTYKLKDYLELSSNLTFTQGSFDKLNHEGYTNNLYEKTGISKLSFNIGIIAKI